MKEVVFFRCSEIPIPSRVLRIPQHQDLFLNIISQRLANQFGAGQKPSSIASISDYYLPDLILSPTLAFSQRIRSVQTKGETQEPFLVLNCKTNSDIHIHNTTRHNLIIIRAAGIIAPDQTPNRVRSETQFSLYSERGMLPDIAFGTGLSGATYKFGMPTTYRLCIQFHPELESNMLQLKLEIEAGDAVSDVEQLHTLISAWIEKNGFNLSEG